MNYIIVEDEFIIRESIYQHLKTTMPGLNCSGQFDSIQELDQYLKHETPDLIFLDINLSDGCGFKYLETLRQVHNNLTPVICITAYRQYETATKQLAFTRYLTKPFKKENLMPIVLSLLQEKNEHNLIEL